MFETNCYNCIENWPYYGIGFVYDDPQFISTNNYRLKSTSPCINAGTNLPYVYTTTDLDGKTRIVNGRVDMGAYEFVPEPCLFIVYFLFFSIYYRRKF